MPEGLVLSPFGRRIGAAGAILEDDAITAK
jgi:hypothetical protein